MTNDKSSGTQPRSRRFGRGLFSSSSKEDLKDAKWLQPRRNSLVPEVQSDSRPRTPVEKPTKNRIPSPIPEHPDIPEEEEEVETSSKPAEDTPVVTKRQSRSSLFDLFTKPKVERARGYHEGSGNSLEAVPERAQTPLPISGTKRLKRGTSPRKGSTTAKEASKQQEQPQTLPPRPSSRLSLTANKLPALRVATEDPVKATKPNDSWNPPPLFQAFPQATKHAKLQTVNSSTEALLRTQQAKRNLSPEASGYNPSTASPFINDNGAQQTELSKLRRLSIMSETPDLIEKVFVLVTAGRIVQYSSSGHSERTPEKILTLGANSAAFVCDLVPGKHFVMQILQDVSAANQPAAKSSRSILSRLRVTGTIARKNATSMLLIFSSPEEMDSWIKAIRLAVEQLGGKKRGADPEVARTKEQEARQQQRLSQLPSHRFLVQRDPQRFTDDRRDSVSPVMAPAVIPAPSPSELARISTTPSVTTPSMDSALPTPVSPIERGTSLSTTRSRRLSSTATSASVPASTSASTSASFPPDLLRLEPLKETSRFSSSSTRNSRASEGDHTSIKSLCSSPSPSPQKDSTLEQPPPRFSPSRPVSSSPKHNLASRRRSAQADPDAPAVPSIPQRAVATMGVLSSSSPSSDKALRPLHAMSLFPGVVSPPSLQRHQSDSRVSPFSHGLNTTRSSDNGRPQRSSINFSTPRNAPMIRHSVPVRPQSSIGNVSVQSMRGRDGRVFSDPIHTAPRARPFFRPLPVRTSVHGEPTSNARSPPAIRPTPTKRLSNHSDISALIPEALVADEIIRKVLEERILEEQMMKEKLMAEQRVSAVNDQQQKWDVQVTEDVVTEVMSVEPESQGQHPFAVQSIDDTSKSLTNFVQERVSNERDNTASNHGASGETFEEGILDLNGLAERSTKPNNVPRPTTPKMRRTSVNDLLSMKEPSPERPVLSIHQRSARAPQHYSQFHSQGPMLNKRLSSAPLPNPPSMPLPAPPPSHMPSLSTRPSSRNAFAPPPVTGIRPGRRTPSVGSLIGSVTISSRSSSPIPGSTSHSRQTSSALGHYSRDPPPAEEATRKLRRPSSMQIRTDHAPFLSARRTGSFSQRPAAASQTTMFQGPYAANVLSKLQTSAFSPLSVLEVKEVEHESPEKPKVPPFSAARSFSQPTFSHRQISSAMAMASASEYLSSRSATEPSLVTEQNLRAVSPLPVPSLNASSHDLSSQHSPSFQSTARSSSPTSSDVSDSAILEIGSPIRRVSNPRLSFIGASGGIIRMSSPPPLPIMNPSRTAIRGKLSMPNMSTAALADLPPPMPPPNCPLPEVPTGPSPLHSPLQSPVLY